MHVDDSACNLASLNLMKFRRPDGTLDVEAFEHAVDIMLLAQEIVVGPSSYPTEEIGANARAFRQLGLGYANLGAYLMSNGMPYDSDDGRAARRGDHRADDRAAPTGARPRSPAYSGSAPTSATPRTATPTTRVMRMHRDASHAIPDDDLPRRRAARRRTAVVGRGRRARRAPRLPQRPGDGARADRDDLVPDGLRHDRASSPTSRWSSSRSSSAAGR